MVRRYRECKDCGARWMSVELYAHHERNGTIGGQYVLHVDHERIVMR